MAVQISNLRAPFDMRAPDYSTPGIGDGLSQNQPAQPFLWGAGGARLTPEQLLAEQEIARSRMQSDYSPVGSVWEGLGRVTDNVLGALDNRRLGREQEQQAVERQAALSSLLGEGNADLAGAFGSGDPVVSALAGDILKSRMPKAQQPNDFERLLLGAGIAPGTPQWAEANRQRAESLYDPTVNANVGGRDFFGPRSMLLENLARGGDSVSGPVPGASPNPPATLPPDFDFGNGGPTPPASGRFR